MIKSILRIVFILSTISISSGIAVFGNNLYLDSGFQKETKSLKGSLEGTLSNEYDYTVDNDIYVESGKTLFIEPGVTLKFSGKFQFNVKGILIAVGNPASPIVFTTSDPLNGSWYGIAFQNAPTPDLKNCQFTNTIAPANDVRGALSFISSKVTEINDCEFVNSQSGAIYLSNVFTESLAVNRIKVRNGEAFGLFYDHCTIDSLAFNSNFIQGNSSSKKGFAGIRIKYLDACKKVKFLKNTIELGRYIPGKSINEGGAVWIDESNSIVNVSFTGDLINDNGGKNGGIYINPAKPLVTFTANNISVIDNRGKFGGCFISSNKIAIEGNSTFSNNSSSDTNLGGGGLTVKPGGSKPVVSILNSKFELNKNNAPGAGKSYGGALHISGDNSSVFAIRVTACEFINNRATNGGAISVDSLNVLTSVNIENNNFVSNSGTENGSVVNLSSITNIGKLAYITNKHVKESATESKEGNGGIGHFDVGKADTISIVGNSGLSSTSKILGGAFFLKSGQISDLNFASNRATYIEAERGGIIFLDCPNVSTIRLNYNSADSSVVSGDGGLFNLNCNGNLNNLEIKSNTCITAKAGNGGVIYFDGIFPENGEVVIEKNKISKLSAATTGEGGFGYFKGNLSGRFSFKENNLNKSTATLDGGVVYINNQNGTIKDLLLSGNTILNSNAINGSGGMLCYKGKLSDSVEISGNIITKTGANSNGGAVCIYNPDGKVNNLLISGNSVTGSLSINGSGGLFQYNGGLSGSVMISGNTIVQSESKGNGGAIDIVNTNPEVLSNFTVFNNPKIGIVNSKFGLGGFLNYSGASLNDLNVEGNKFDGSCNSGKSGGAYAFQVNSINNFVVQSETVNSTNANNDGGFLYVLSDTVKTAEFSKIKVNILAKAGELGGLVCLNVKEITQKLKVSNCLISGKLEAKSGGLIAFSGDLTGKNEAFTIISNTINADVNVAEDGGIVYFNGKLDQDFLFQKNIFNKNISVKNNGGLIYISNISGSFGNLTISENNCNESKSINSNLYARNGGFIYLTGDFSLGSLNFSNNLVYFITTKVDDSGALISLENNSNQPISTIDISNNDIGKLLLGGNGGCLSAKAAISEQIRFVNNDIGSSIAGQGALLNIENGINTVLSTLLISGNTIKEQLITTSGNGAFISYLGNSLNVLKVNYNKLENASSKTTGSFSFRTNKIGQLKSSSNSFTGKSEGDGSIYYLNSNSIDSVLFEKENFSNCSSKYGSGGGIYLDVNKIDKLMFNSVQIDGVEAGKSGGFCCFKDGILIKKFIFGETNKEPQTVANCSSKLDGGLFYINGTVDNAFIENTNFKNITAGRNGGGWYLKGLNIVTFNSNSFNSLVSKDSGGAVFVDSVRSASFTNNSFEGNSTEAGSGGAIYSSKVDSAFFYGNNYKSNTSKKADGGALSITDGYFEISNDTINSCMAVTKAGAIYIVDACGKIENTRLLKNSLVSSLGKGSGIYVTCKNDSIRRKEGVSFKDNYFGLNSGGNYGGAVYLDHVKSKFVRNKFFENSSSEGGALYFHEGSSRSELWNCLFYQNKSLSNAKAGSAIQVYPVNSLESNIPDTLKIINNTIFNHNSYAFFVEMTESKNSYQIVNSILHANNTSFGGCDNQFQIPDSINSSVRYSNIQCVENNGKSIADCFDENPRLRINENTFCLRDDSPCIDAGDPDKMYNDDKTRAPISYGTLRNDIGITGGPERYIDCRDILLPGADGIVNSASLLSPKSFEVYPNPASGQVYVKYNLADCNAIRIEILSMYGQVLWNENINESLGAQSKNINISGLPKGIYIIRLITENDALSAELIKN